jgi:hypothetical protein
MSAASLLPGTFENVDRRVLSAFRLVDSITSGTITAPMTVRCAPLTLRQNRSGIWVVFNGPGFASLTNSFLPPDPGPTAVSFALSIQDPSGQYLPRLAAIRVPAPLTPASDPASIFNPQPITLYASAGAALGVNWAVIRASVTRAAATPPQGLENAILRVTRTSDNSPLAVAMTDARGEALLAVPGLGVRAGSSAGGPVLEATTAVSVEAFFDSNSLNQPSGSLPDPDQLLANLGGASVKTAAQTAQLGAGLTISLSFSISV